MSNNKQKNAALLVASGIFLSRIFGFVRERIFAHYFGNSIYADAFRSAFRIPNLLQNLLGEGVLSASFIPVYSRLLKEGKEQEAKFLAFSVLNILFLFVVSLVMLGSIKAEFLVSLIAPGFESEKKELTIKLTSILFFSTGILVLSAWCLGVLNSHRKFFISYSSPVLWNLAVIIILLIFGNFQNQSDLIVSCSWAVFLGSILQFSIQLYPVYRCIGGYKLIIDKSLNSLKKVLTNFVPVVLSRGVVQISAYIDNILASLLSSGSVSAISYMQIVFTLPVSIFGMSVSASELPQMSQELGSEEEIKQKISQRLLKARTQLSYFIIPSAVCFVVLGDLLVSCLFQTGSFTTKDTRLVYLILAISGFGLYSNTHSRLLASTFFALHNTKTPFYNSLIRVGTSTFVGILAVFYVPKYFNSSTYPLALMALVFASTIASILEFCFLKRSLKKVVDIVDIAFYGELKLILLSSFTAIVLKSIFIKYSNYNLIENLIYLFLYAIFYFILTLFFKVKEAQYIYSKIGVLK